MRLEKKYNEREKENEQAKETKSRQWGKKKKSRAVSPRGSSKRHNYGI